MLMVEVTAGVEASCSSNSAMVEVRCSGGTCRALANAVTTWGGICRKTLVEISSFPSFCRCKASRGKSPVKAKNKLAATPYTSVASVKDAFITYCSNADTTCRQIRLQAGAHLPHWANGKVDQPHTAVFENGNGVRG